MMDKVSLIDPQTGIWVITLFTSYHLSLGNIPTYSIQNPSIHHNPWLTLTQTHNTVTVTGLLLVWVSFEAGMTTRKWKLWGFSRGSHEGGLVDEGGQGDVTLREATTLVGAERDLNLERERAREIGLVMVWK